MEKLKINQEEILKILQGMKEREEETKEETEERAKENAKIMRLEELQSIIQFFKDFPTELQHEDSKTVYRIFTNEIDRRLDN